VDAASEEAIVKWLRNAIHPGHKLISICSGALMAGRAGLLDGHACTTHHSCCAELTKLAPKARVLDNRLYVEDHNCYTSAGITTGVDLMLHLVGQLIGQLNTVAVARYLVVYLRRSGADPQLSAVSRTRWHELCGLQQPPARSAGPGTAESNPPRHGTSGGTRGLFILAPAATCMAQALCDRA
jgi:transcriptional regulator GlxA family with amidase domain